MAEEIKKDEILEDEQLEQVAGGTAAEIASDIATLKDMGIIPASAKSDDADLLKRAFALYGIDVETDKWHHNRYVLQDKHADIDPNVGHDGAWAVINELYYNRKQQKFTT
ncbi:MAG: hypothetical protein J5809_08085 [Selenomonadaceae bacterium]|nr:hypothetical protein [Selenomonadaceae bacterium]